MKKKQTGPGFTLPGRHAWPQRKDWATLDDAGLDETKRRELGPDDFDFDDAEPDPEPGDFCLPETDDDQ